MPSELQSLLDLAVKQGHTQSQLIELAKKDILLEYYRNTPNAPKDATVLLDPHTGTVRIYSQDKDITPKSFTDQAAGIARQTIIGKLHTTKDQPAPPAPKTTSTSQLIKNKLFSHLNLSSLFLKLIFWGYNFMFIFIAIVFFLGLFSSDFRHTLLEDLKTLGALRSTTLLILGLIPFATVIHAVKHKLHHNVKDLMKLFFLFEIPMITITYIILTTSQHATTGLWFFFLMLLISPSVLYTAVTDPDNTKGANQYFTLIITQLVLITFSYICLLYLFYLPPLLGALLQFIFKDVFDYYNIRHIILDFNIFALFIGVIWLGIKLILAFFALIALLLPFLISYIIYHQFIQAKNSLSALAGNKATKVIIITLVAYLVFLGIASYQPDRGELISRLTDYNQAKTYADKAVIVKELTAQKAHLTTALKDGQDHRHHYPWTKDEDQLSDGYQDIFDLSPVLADYIQDAFLNLAYPFVYQGGEVGYSTTQAFQDIFGHPYSQNQVTKPSPPRTNVLLADRTVSAVSKKDGYFATITIEEKYHNQTNNQQEVIYEFSLPQDAVITDLKLGPQLEFEGIIAPKGAAQTTYQSQLQQRRDPALLEQIGPRQYRLRIFPIPGKSDRTTLNGDYQKVSFSYVTTATTEGYPLPIYSLTSNIDVKDSNINYRLDNQLTKPNNNKHFLKSKSVNLCQFPSQSITLEDGTSLSIQSLHDKLPCDSASQTFDLADTSKLNIALFYETSHQSNNTVFTEIKDLLKNNPSFLTQNTVDLYSYNSQTSQKTTLTPDNIKDIELTFFENGVPFTQLNKFDNPYDLMVVYTAQADNDFTSAGKIPDNINFPVYWLFQDGLIPPFHQNLTTSLANNKSLVVDSFTQAINHYVTNLKLQDSKNLLAINPHTYSTLNPSESLVQFIESVESPIDARLDYLRSKSLLDNNPTAGAYLARSFTQHIIATNALKTNDLVLLDALHQFAVTNRTVTPYSSLLSLVNEQQLRQLELESQRYDRFQEQRQITNRNTPSVLRPIVNPSLEIESPTTFKSTPSLGSGFFGMDMAMESKSPSFGGGLGTAYTNGGGSYGIGLPFASSSLGIFIILPTIILFGVGTSIILIGHLRRKHTNK